MDVCGTTRIIFFFFFRLHLFFIVSEVIKYSRLFQIQYLMLNMFIIKAIGAKCYYIFKWDWILRFLFFAMITNYSIGLTVSFKIQFFPLQFLHIWCLAIIFICSTFYFVSGWFFIYSVQLPVNCMLYAVCPLAINFNFT